MLDSSSALFFWTLRSIPVTPSSWVWETSSRWRRCRTWRRWRCHSCSRKRWANKWRWLGKFFLITFFLFCLSQSSSFPFSQLLYPGPVEQLKRSPDYNARNAPVPCVKNNFFVGISTVGNFDRNIEGSQSCIILMIRFLHLKTYYSSRNHLFWTKNILMKKLSSFL